MSGLNESNGESRQPRWFDLLKNPWLSVATMAIGVFVGSQWDEVGAMLRAPADLYLALLTMSVLPIISTAIISSIAAMLHSGLSNRFLVRMILLFMVAGAAGSATGMVAAFLGEPGANLGSAGEAFIGRSLLDVPAIDASAGGLWALLAQIIPTNVIGAYSQGEILAVIFISVLLGSSLGVSSSASATSFLNMISGIHESFVRILSWILYGLPFGLFCMMAAQVSTIGIDALFSLSRFILLFYVAGAVLIVIYLTIMRLASGMPLLTIISALKEPLFVAFSAASSVAPIPIALQQMRKRFGQHEAVSGVVVPLSVAIGRHSYAMLFSFTAVFLSQLFDRPLDLYQLILLFALSALVGTVAAGRLATSSLLLVYVLEPVGLPAQVAVTIFLTIGAILDPMVQMLILFGGCANSTVMARVIPTSRLEQNRDEW
jgi:proton glutamate symport protein